MSDEIDGVNEDRCKAILKLFSFPGLKFVECETDHFVYERKHKLPVAKWRKITDD